MLTGRRFVIHGLSHLTARVAEDLLEQNATVVVIGDPGDDPEARETVDRLDGRAQIIDPGFDRDQALLRAGVADAAGVLLLGDEDLDSLRMAAAAHELAPGVPVVLRTFQPELVDEVSEELNIRRAYSTAALAAPSFVAAAIGAVVLQTLRLGDEEVPLSILEVHASSPLLGMTPHEVKVAHDCGVVALLRSGERWAPAEDAAHRLGTGDRVLVGGRQLDVLRLALRNDEAARSSGRAAKTPATAPTRKAQATAGSLRRSGLLQVAAVMYAVALVANVAVRVASGRGVLDAVFDGFATSVGNLPPATDSAGQKVFDLAMVALGIVLPWIILSYVTAFVLAERLELRMARVAARMEDHIVLVGLGRIGYRVAQILADLGIPTVVLEQDTESSFADAIAVDLPLLRGDGRLPENLERCGVAHARCIMALTSDDLANLASCREARRLHPQIRTVLRAFDETVSERLASAFRIDSTLSSTSVASRAFVGAAVDEYAMRTITLDRLTLLAYRFSPRTPVEAGTIAQWREKGLRVLALDRGGVVLPPAESLTHTIGPDDEAIVVGPESVIRAFAERYR